MRRPVGIPVAALVCSCSSPARNPPAIPAPVASTRAEAEPAFLRTWADARKLSLRAKPAAADNGQCVAHAGCSIEGERLPACTDPGPLPAGFERIQGELRYYLSTQALDQPFTCGDGYEALLVIYSGEVMHWLTWFACSGDRTGMCCPYPNGTRVQAIYPRGQAALQPSWEKKPYYLCVEAEPAPPSAEPQAAPVVIDASPLGLSGHEPFYRRTGAPVVGWWFHDRVALWNPHHRELTVLSNPTGAAISCAEAAPDGKRAVTVDATGNALLWDADTGRQLGSIENAAPPSAVGGFEPEASCTLFRLRDLQWNPDGKEAFLQTEDGRLLLWDLASGKPRALATLPDAAWTESVFSADGAYVLVQAKTGQTTVYEVRTGRAVFDKETFTSMWLPRGAQLALGIGPRQYALTWQLWDAKSGSVQDLPVGCTANFGVGYFTLTECPPVPGPVRIYAYGSKQPTLTIENASEGQWSPVDGTLLVRTKEGVKAWSKARGLRSLGKEGREIVGRPPEGRPFYVGPTGRYAGAPGFIFDLRTDKAVSLADANDLPVRGAHSPGGGELLRWQTSRGSVYTPTTELVARVFDITSGALLFQGDERTASQPARYTDAGVPAPHWLAGTDILVLPSVTNAAVVRLVRPRLGRSLWMTVSTDGDRLVPFAWDTAGHYDGPETFARGESGGKLLPVSSQRQPGLLNEFLSARLVAGHADLRR